MTLNGCLENAIRIKVIFKVIFKVVFKVLLMSLSSKYYLDLTTHNKPPP